MGHRTCLRGNYVASETIGFVDHQSCWTGMRIEGKFESDSREIPDFDSAIQKLVTNELDIAVIPAQLVHGNHMRLLSDGLSVSGGLEPKQAVSCSRLFGQVESPSQISTRHQRLENSQEAIEEIQKGPASTVASCLGWNL